MARPPHEPMHANLLSFPEAAARGDCARASGAAAERASPRDDDEHNRRTALDTSRSFMVQAPAGSGKTELLIRRFLRLLAVVERPEAIVAITFTRKAAGEMRNRILSALVEAERGTPVDRPHQQWTRELALDALERNRILGWDLLQQPGRLRIQTIDAMCAAIAGSMPWLTQLGAMPRIEDDTRPLYQEAARRTILLLGNEHGEPVERVLAHLDGGAVRLRQMLSEMLAVRDQWCELAFLSDDQERAAIEEAMTNALEMGIAAADALIPPELRRMWLDLARRTGRGILAWPGPSCRIEWQTLIDLVLTNSGSFRRSFTRASGFEGLDRETKQLAADLIERLESTNGLNETLNEVRTLPPGRYGDAQWEIMRALLQTLRLSVAALRQVFAENGVIDFCEIGQAARRALGTTEDPTELAFRMDARIDHLLVDEFQDTSRGQFELIRRLTSGWEEGDGRTLFLVGDPMQSIYRFRQAEVGLFLEVKKKHGLGNLQINPLRLRANYRSTATIVERVNQIFQQIFPPHEDIAIGAIPYSESIAPNGVQGGGNLEDPVSIELFAEGDERREAARVIEHVREARQRDPTGSVAILVRARTHLTEIVEALKSAGLTFRAVEIDPIRDRVAVQDLVSLTRAMLHRGDRIAWLAILRAPWCGLTLADLEALVKGREKKNIWESLQDLSRLSNDGMRRAEYLRSVLHSAFAEQGRWPIRRWIERAWIQLGGPACLCGDNNALRDASEYFDLLEREQVNGDLLNIEAFLNRVENLFSQPDPHASDWLHIMTIHKAKGLQFDTVIVPGLGRREKVADPPLFFLHEWSQGDRTARLLAPVHETGSDGDPLYEYLKRIDKKKSNLERVRQLYVAATRAKQRLHLLGEVVFNKNGEPKAHPGSMLADLWPALSEDERRGFVVPDQAAGAASSAPVTLLRRLPVSWSLPDQPKTVHWTGDTHRPAKVHEPTFEWVSESLRQAGTVVHAYLQRMNNVTDPLPGTTIIRRLLMHAGVTPAEIDSMAHRVRSALERIVNSPRARWIFGPHREIRREYAITGVVDGDIVQGKVDRTFVDEHGVRWIIDFKTSAHEGAGLEQFLDEQQRRYREQMERYASLLNPLGNPVRLGLYFPLLDGWREWAPGDEAGGPQLALF